MQVVYIKNGFTDTLQDIFLSVYNLLEEFIHIQRKHLNLNIKFIFLIWFSDFSGTRRKYLIQLQTSHKLKTILSLFFLEFRLTYCILYTYVLYHISVPL